MFCFDEKLDCALWTTRAVSDLIIREFNVEIGRRAVGNYLNSWGFTPQKPKKRTYEQCTKKVQKWLDEEYPAIKEKVEHEKATIHWGDETGVKTTIITDDHMRLRVKHLLNSIFQNGFRST